MKLNTMIEELLQDTVKYPLKDVDSSAKGIPAADISLANELMLLRSKQNDVTLSDSEMNVGRFYGV